MSIRDLLYETFSALFANKARSLLTILGIVIGISAVIAMTSLIDGAKQALVSELGLDQSRAVYIMFYSAQETTMEDVGQLQENVEGYEFVTGMQWASAEASTGSKQAGATVMGVADNFFKTTSLTVVAGRLLTPSELSGSATSVVIDTTLARWLYDDNDEVVGTTLSLGDDAYTVVGLVEASSRYSSQGSAYIPLETCAARLSGYKSVDQIVGFAEEGADIDSVVERTESYLRKRYQITEEAEDAGMGYVYVESMKSVQQELDSTLATFQLLMTAVAGISLLVGGIGIMNMMLTNVTERIREIGLRKALGARKADITRQFLLESVAICLAGGIIGFALGLLAAWALSGVASSVVDGLSIKPAVSLSTVALAVGICTAIGIVFGIGPARRAAKLDPVESLRYQ